ncbi:hypothetical protein [Streptomyces shenzhenensis]|uniref:hypothetical protein n=1 Tax=Streptomyces shenzhenensis TaxID=943815 RepID=UPI00369036E2
MAEPARKQPHPALEPVRAAATGTYAAFTGCGFGPATCLSRLAEVREHRTVAVCSVVAGTRQVLLGLLGDRLGMPHTLIAVAALQLVACAIAAVTRPPAVAPAAALKSA